MNIEISFTAVYWQRGKLNLNRISHQIYANNNANHNIATNKNEQKYGIQIKYLGSVCDESSTKEKTCQNATCLVIGLG